MRLLEQLRSVPFSLVVRLPRNDPDLARAALDAGADGLMVHLHVERPTGGRFGAWVEELIAIESICTLSDRPVGLVPGAETFASADDLQQAAEVGIEFIAGHITHLPAYALRTSFTIMAGLNHTVSSSDVATLHELACVHCIEVATVPRAELGTPLNLADLLRYRQIAADGGKPVVVRTQRAITPQDIPLLMEAGVRGLVLDASVTGTTATELAAAVTAFRTAIPPLETE